MKRRIRIILYLTILPVLILALFLGYRAVLKQLYPIGYAEIVEEAAQEFGLDPLLVYAVINCESGFDQNAVSGADAMGLMQITEETFNWAQSRLAGEVSMKKNRLFDPGTNIRYGSFILSMHLNEFGSVELALAAYHAGRGSVQGWLKDDTLTKDGESLHTIPFKDTAQYVKKVGSALSVYEKLYR